MNELALFAGAGGGILGGKLLGWRTVCAVEWEPYAASVLAQRQNDGLLPPFPIWDDVQTFDGRPWKGLVDVVSGGFPCQDISCAGKGAGIDGERSGMWSHMARIVGEVRPRYVFVENSPMLTLRGLDRVLGDLSEMGYDARWGVVGAFHAGAPHKRERIWIVANTGRIGEGSMQNIQPSGQEPIVENPPNPSICRSKGGNVAHAQRKRLQGIRRQSRNKTELPQQGVCNPDTQGREGWWATEPDVGRVAHGVANRVDRLKAIGNGQVPQCAALAWRILTGER